MSLHQIYLEAMYIDVDVRICSDLTPLLSWSLDRYLVIFMKWNVIFEKMSYTDFWCSLSLLRLGKPLVPIVQVAQIFFF